MADEMEQKLSAAIAADLAKPINEPRALRAVAVKQTVATLSEQLASYERVQRELKERLRRETIRFEHEYRQRRQAIIADHDVRIHESITRMEDTREKELQDLAREYHDKV